MNCPAKTLGNLNGRVRALTLALLLFSLCPHPGHGYPASEDLLVFELWTELEPVVAVPQRDGDGGDENGAGDLTTAPGGAAGGAGGSVARPGGPPAGPGGLSTGPEPLSQEEAIARLLEDARIVVSAMIYGYRVEYTPPDRARGVSERLTAEPVARIDRGDVRLTTAETWLEDGKFFARFRYDLADFQISRREAWRSNTIPSVIARGTAPLREGYRGKFSSYEEAMKEGLRAYLRPREFNKPREIIARVLFLESPYTRMTAGGYHSKVRMKLRIREVVPYGAY